MFALELLNKLDMLKKQGKYLEQKWIKGEVFHVNVPKKVLKKLNTDEPNGINILTQNF